MTQEMVNQLGAVICLIGVLVTISCAGNYWLTRNHQEKEPEVEPVENNDDLPPAYAVMLAWSEAEATSLSSHLTKKELVRSTMPALARALDRMVEN